ncbi:hypothetical protein LQW54_001980 [Pestalotiopsis sp. IQ-011]
MKTPGAMFMEDVDPAAFDAQFFQVNSSDACSMDPQQRVFMEVAYECLENAGIPKGKVEGTRLGCITTMTWIAEILKTAPILQQ